MKNPTKDIIMMEEKLRKLGRWLLPCENLPIDFDKMMGYAYE